MLSASAGVASAAAAREAEAWETYATATRAVADIGADELLLRPAEELLQRAVPGLDLRMFDTQAVSFACRCSRERVTGMLRSLGAAEVRSIVAEQGAVLTQFPFLRCADRQTFPIRNRIVAGLTLGTVVVEANLNGGALITANFATDYGWYVDLPDSGERYLSTVLFEGMFNEQGLAV